MRVAAGFILGLLCGAAMAGGWEVTQTPEGSVWVMCRAADCPPRTVKVLDMHAPVVMTPPVAAARGVPAPLTLLFGLASARLSGVERRNLAGLVRAAGTSARYAVSGSTDRLGARAYNHRLALKRARAAAAALHRMGVPHRNIIVGSRCCVDDPPPVNPGARRVVIEIIGVEQQ